MLYLVKHIKSLAECIFVDTKKNQQILVASFTVHFNVILNETSHVNKVSKGAKIRNGYNQVPHLTQDTIGKVTNSQLLIFAWVIASLSIHTALLEPSLNQWRIQRMVRGWLGLPPPPPHF